MDTLFALVPWVVFAPVLGILINLLVGKRLGEKAVGIIGSLASGAAFIISVILAVALGQHPEGVVHPLAEWMTIGDFSVRWAFQVDTLSTTMMLVVSGVGTLIHIYSIGYMHADTHHHGDPGRFRRFFVYLNLFIAMMMVLVTADSYLMLFVGWEGVGLCSYLLIGFWYEKGEAGLGNARAGRKAFIVNRVGDFGLLIAMFVMFWAFGSLDFATVFAQAGTVAAGALLAITLFMLLAVTGKSAQLPLFVWLPDAMAGPTPVSALIHAATMVTAGVYLVARSQPLFALVPAAQTAVTWVGALTALFAATIAVGQYDIKKVLAYSTISQLGFMVAAVGMGAVVGGMFHLITHAFFKALLFLAAGSVILGLERGHEAALNGQHLRHDHFDPQDMRNMGGLRPRMRITYWVYLIGALALAGIAPLAGFFSKDEILAAASEQSLAVFIILAIAAFFTAFYMGRQLILVFGGKPRSRAAEGAAENSPIITVPLIILAVLAALGGLLNLPGLHWLETWLEHSLAGLSAGHFILWVALLSLAVALLGFWLAWSIYARKPRQKPAEPDPLAAPLGDIYRGMERKWWVDEFYRAVLLRPAAWLANLLAGPVDQGGIDGAVMGTGRLTRLAARGLSLLQNGFVRGYALVMLLGVVAILTYLVLR
ncbi:MAG TPA: NADH-quinone oxidoreductase subunit L [Anaerolineaceae bacterium]|nr:NADH-quinone oxidoreductase subunit L [Anaerolineaceae bacterium]